LSALQRTLCDRRVAVEGDRLKGLGEGGLGLGAQQRARRLEQLAERLAALGEHVREQPLHRPLVAAEAGWEWALQPLVVQKRAQARAQEVRARRGQLIGTLE